MRRILLILPALALAAGAATIALRPPSALPEAAPPAAVIPTRPEFYDAAYTEPAWRQVSEEPRSGIRAMVVPHHLLAARLIARPLRSVSDRHISTVVIIGPNHDDLGGVPVITAEAEWEVPGGRVGTDPEAVAGLVAATGARRDAKVFLAEHSVGAVVPFVARAFPQARLVPVIVASTAVRSDAETLAAWIAGLGEETLVVFSIDFSHYLTEPDALRRDAETRAAILRGDVDTVLTYDSAHLDAAPVLATALLAARRLGWRTEFLDHATANDFLEIKSGSISTYFSMLFLADGE